MDSEAIEDLFAPAAHVSVRRMFGGKGIFVEGIMVGLEADGVLYLKADEATAAAFDAEGCGPFAYGEGGRRVITSYRRMPESAFEDPDELRRWYAMARDAAFRKAREKKPRRRTTAS
jgi:DNA transformation protein